MSQNYFTHEQVRAIRDAELKSGTEGLKERVLSRVKEVTGIHGKLPKRLISWVHQYCMAITAGIPMKEFEGFMATALDLGSLPQRQRSTK